METVREFIYLNDSVCSGGGREDAATAIIRCEAFSFRECTKLQYQLQLPLKL